MKNRLSMEEFGREVIGLLQTENIEFLVGGYYALRTHIEVQRDTKDLDLMVRPSDVGAVLTLCRSAGYNVQMAYSHWLAKIRNEDYFADVIFNSGNGLCAVDDEWFSRSETHLIFDKVVKTAPLEEIIWQKAYIMERERFDGADIAHLLFTSAGQIDWDHLMKRFGPDWRVLLSHLVLFGFIYPSRTDAIPPAVMDELLQRLESEKSVPAPDVNVCNGALLSRNQYISDIERDGLLDARLSERSAMTPVEIKMWTQAGLIEQERQKTELA
jgi:hypothetical protein